MAKFRLLLIKGKQLEAFNFNYVKIIGSHKVEILPGNLD